VHWTSYGLMKGTPYGAGRSSVSGLRYFSDSRVRSSAKRNMLKKTSISIKYMERERLKKKQVEIEKAECEKSGKIVEEEAQKI